MHQLKEFVIRTILEIDYRRECSDQKLECVEKIKQTHYSKTSTFFNLLEI